MPGARLHPKSVYSNVLPKGVRKRVAIHDRIVVALAVAICVAAPLLESSTEKLSAESAATTFVHTPETTATYPAPSHEVRP